MQRSGPALRIEGRLRRHMDVLRGVSGGSDQDMSVTLSLFVCQLYECMAASHPFPSRITERGGCLLALMQ